jgi:hypothetical protein
LGDPKLGSTQFVLFDNVAYELKNRELRKRNAGGCFFPFAKKQRSPENPT